LLRAAVKSGDLSRKNDRARRWPLRQTRSPLSVIGEKCKAGEAKNVHLMRKALSPQTKRRGNG
jgi:hypothetical protein